MTTVADVRKLVRPLIERHPDLALVGRWIFVKPVHHFARAILIDRTSDPNAFDPSWAVVHLFQAREFFPLNWGEFLDNEGSSHPTRWQASDPGLARDLFAAIERQALSKLRAMTTLEDYLAYVSQHFFRHKLYEWADARMVLESALGNLDVARAVGKDNVHLWTDSQTIDEAGRQKFGRLRELYVRLVENDRSGIVRLLREWEAYTARNLKIEQLWQPTPFPVELQSATMSQA